MSISIEESISILIEIYKECCPDEIVHFKQEIANGNGEWLIDSCLNDYKIKSEDINLKLYQSGRIAWLLSYLLNYHHTVLIDYFLSKIDKEKNKKGVNTTYSLENLFSVLLKSGNLRINELEKLLDKKTREDIVYGFRGSTEYLRYAIEKSKKELDKSSEKPEIKLLKSIIKELKDKQKFEPSKIPTTDIDQKSGNTPEPINPYPFVFPNKKCWGLFEYWEKNAVDLKADLCFVYWKMKKDELINDITPRQYKDWLLKELNVDFGDYWKQLYRCTTPEKERHYLLAKRNFLSN